MPLYHHNNNMQVKLRATISPPKFGPFVATSASITFHFNFNNTQLTSHKVKKKKKEKSKST